MPRKLSEFKRTVARIEWLRDQKRISGQQASHLIERARLKYESWALQFEHQRGKRA